jgi:glutamine cyclotransferase
MELRTVVLASLIFIFYARNDKKKEQQAADIKNPPALLNYHVVATHLHDTSAFTEGLLFHDGKLFESTGSPNDLPNTKSVVGISDLTTGELSPVIELDRGKYFGEGITFLNDKLYQLTYTSRVGFIYDASTFAKIGEFKIPTKEGWGLTTDGTHLIMSDGTNTITYLKPDSLVAVKSIKVSDDKGAVTNINELEYINGFIYSNVYTTNYIIKIDPATGVVLARLDLTSLAQDAKLKNKNALELNGIAYDSVTKNIFVTGKFWSNIYEIKFNH